MQLSHDKFAWQEAKATLSIDPEWVMARPTNFLEHARLRFRAILAVLLYSAIQRFSANCHSGSIHCASQPKPACRAMERSSSQEYL